MTLRTFASSLFILLASIGLALFVTFPTVTTLSTHFIGDGGDSYEYASYMLLASHNLALHTDFWRYPQGFDFFRSFDSVLTVGTGAFLTTLFGMPLAYNLTVLILFVLNGLSSFFVFGRITNSKLLGFLGMIMYGFSFYTIAKAAGHPNLLFTGGLLLLLFSLYELIRKNVLRQKDFFLVCFSLILTALGSTEYIVIFGIFFPLFLLLFWAFYKPILRKTIHKITHFRNEAIPAVIVCVSAFFVLYLPHFIALFQNDLSFPNRLSISNYLIPNLTDYILPNSYLRLALGNLFPNPSLGSIDKVVFVGWIEILLSIFFFFSDATKRLKLFLLSLFAVPFIFSLGYGNEALPYTYLVGFFPFSVVVETGRFVVLFSIVTSLLTLLFLKTIKENHLLKVLVGITLLGLILERAPTEFYTSQLSLDPYIDIVAKQNSSAVLDIPFDLSSRKYNMYSFYYQKPIVDGYFHFLGDGPKEKTYFNDTNLWRFMCVPNDSMQSQNFEDQENQKLLTSLIENHITTLVVHKDEVFFHPVCDNVRARITSLIPYSASFTPSIYQQKIEGTIYEGKPSITLFVPVDGILNIDGVYIAPLTPADFSLYQNGQPVTVDYSWKNSDQGGILIQPENTIELPVHAGDTISFYTTSTVKQTEFSIWYRLNQMSDTVLPFYPHFEKLYDDTKATVYKIQ